MAPVLVLLHGFTHTGASWRRVVRALPQSYTALAPDLRGHGSRGSMVPVTLQAVVEDVMAEAPPRFVLGGYSMGGRLALHLALAEAVGRRVERLVLVGASPGLEDPAERAARRAADEQLASELEGEDLEVFASRWEELPVLAGLPDDVAREAHADRLRNTPAGLARALRGLGTGVLPPLWHRLPELSVPVALVVGERDEKFQAVATAMARRIPRAEVVVVQGAAHAVHLQAPARVAAILAAEASL